jgi:tetratricopeptide (TPR) repeat protein
MFRDEHKLNHALSWFERALKLNDGDANLEIAKICLEKVDQTKAVHYLQQALSTNPLLILEESQDEAKRILRKLENPGQCPLPPVKPNRLLSGKGGRTRPSQGIDITD